MHGSGDHGLSQQLCDALGLPLRGVAENHRVCDIVQRLHRNDLRIFRRANRTILPKRRASPVACWDAAVRDARRDNVGAVVDSPHDLFDTVESREFGRASLRRELDDRAGSRSTDRSAARHRSEHNVRVANVVSGARRGSAAAAHVRPGIDGIVLCWGRRGSVSGRATG